MSEAVLVPHAHDLLWVTGPDAVSFLDGQLSQDVAAMARGSVARSFLLEPRGKVVAVLWLLRDEERVGIMCDPGMGATVAQSLERFRIRVKAEITQAPGPVAGVWGHGAPQVVEAAGLPAPEGWADEPVVAALHVGGLFRFAVAGVEPAVLASAGAEEASDETATALRIEAGEPAVPVDVDGSVIPQESGLVAEAVSFTKGCFLGQELVARIDSRGRVNRHLQGLVLAGDEAPPSGAAIERDGDAVGRVGSSARSVELGGPVALALVRREIAPGEAVVVRWEGREVRAMVRELPLRDFAGEGPPVS